MDEDEKTRLNAQLQKISARLQEQPEVMVTDFAPDERKTAGGARQTYRGRLRKIDRNRRNVDNGRSNRAANRKSRSNIECE